MKYLKVIVFLIAAVFGINASAAQFRLMGEMDTGTGGAGNESYIYSYDTFEDLLANNYSSYSATQIDWSSTYSTAGLAYELTPVPVPAAMWLFGSGFLGLVGVARRKKS